MGRRIDPSWGGPIELFLVPASAPHNCVSVHITVEPLLLIVVAYVAAAGFLSHYQNGPYLTPYNRR